MLTGYGVKDFSSIPATSFDVNEENYFQSSANEDKIVKTSLHEAIYNRDSKILGLLLKSGVNINLLNVKGESALYLAIRENYPECVNILLNYGKRHKNMFYRKYYEFCQTIIEGCDDIFHWLLQVIQDVDFLNLPNESPLRLAVLKRQESFVKSLLQKGARIDLDKGVNRISILLDAVTFFPPLREICSEQQVQNRIIKELLKFYCGSLDTVLLTATLRGIQSWVDLLLQQKVNVNHQNKYGQTALHLALDHQKNYSLVKMLLDFGADSGIMDNLENSPLHLAVTHISCPIEIIDQLVANSNFSVNSKNLNNETPLHLAKGCKNQFAILKHGGNLDIPRKTGVFVTLNFKCAHLYPRNPCPVIAHIKKVRLLGYQIDKKNFQDFPKSFFWEILKEEETKYKGELTELNNEVFNTFPRKTLFDIFFMKRDELAKYSRNEKLASFNFTESFKHYGYLLKILFQKGQKRKKFIIEAQVSLSVLIGDSLPETCCESIFKYLNDEELVNFCQF